VKEGLVGTLPTQINHKPIIDMAAATTNTLLSKYERDKHPESEKKILYGITIPKNLPAPTFTNEYVVVRKSTIPGTNMRGLFAKKDIPKNTLIADYKGIEMTITHFNELYDRDYRYSYSMRRQNKIINGRPREYLTENPSHYTNESIPKNVNVELVKKGFYTTKDIKKGDELFLQYPKNYPRTYSLSLS
jgi:hypothetical protein